MDSITIDTVISLDEAATALQMPTDALASLTRDGPFQRATADTLTVRRAYGASLTLMLPMFDPHDAAAIAVAAADGAAIGGSRAIILAWHRSQRGEVFWIQPSDRLPLAPLMHIPTDAMVTKLAEHIAAHRAQQQRLN